MSLLLLLLYYFSVLSLLWTQWLLIILPEVLSCFWPEENLRSLLLPSVQWVQRVIGKTWAVPVAVLQAHPNSTTPSNHSCVQTNYLIWGAKFRKLMKSANVSYLYIYFVLNLIPGLAQCVQAPFSWEIWITAWLKGIRITQYRNTWDTPDPTQGQHKASCFGLGSFFGGGGALSTVIYKHAKHETRIALCVWYVSSCTRYAIENATQHSLGWVMYVLCFVPSWKTPSFAVFSPSNFRAACIHSCLLYNSIQGCPGFSLPQNSLDFIHVWFENKGKAPSLPSGHGSIGDINHVSDRRMDLWPAPPCSLAGPSVTGTAFSCTSAWEQRSVYRICWN